MNPQAIKIVADIVGGLVPVVIDLVKRGVSGEDISHDELMKRLPGELSSTKLAEIKTEARRAMGIPI